MIHTHIWKLVVLLDYYPRLWLSSLDIHVDIPQARGGPGCLGRCLGILGSREKLHGAALAPIVLTEAQKMLLQQGLQVDLGDLDPRLDYLGEDISKEIIGQSLKGQR